MCLSGKIRARLRIRCEWVESYNTRPLQNWNYDGLGLYDIWNLRYPRAASWLTVVVGVEVFLSMYKRIPSLKTACSFLTNGTALLYPSRVSFSSAEYLRHTYGRCLLRYM